MDVINLYGGPCSGKSTIMAGVFYKLKEMGKNVEMSPEFVKDSVYDGNPYPFKDQIYVFANMLKRLRQFDGKVDYVVTDAPLLMNLVYAENESDSFYKLVRNEYDKYNNYAYILRRGSVKYQNNGRVNTKKESDRIQRVIENILENQNIKAPILYLSKDDPVDYIIDDILTSKDKYDVCCLGFSYPSSETFEEFIRQYKLIPNVSDVIYKNLGFGVFNGRCSYHTRLKTTDNYPESFTFEVDEGRTEILSVSVLDENFLQPTYVSKDTYKQIKEFMDSLVEAGILTKGDD